MKIFFLVWLFIVAVNSSSFAQEKPDRNALYEFLQPTKLKQCDNLGDSIKNKFQVFDSELQFEITAILKNGDLVIDIVHFIENSDENKNLNLKYRGNHNPYDPDFFFLIPSTSFDIVAEKVQSQWSFSFGTASTLLKYRPGSSKLLQNKYPISSDIGNDFSIGALIGIQSSAESPIKKYILGGVNYTNIKVTPQSSQGSVITDTNVGALTPSLAFVFEIKKVQLGLFSGIDMLTGSVGKSWVYRGRPWFGFGIGLSIFKDSSSPKNPTQK